MPVPGLAPTVEPVKIPSEELAWELAVPLVAPVA
jgi:hypothetical protein